MDIVLAGNPNAGKTTLFNALTGSNLKTGNFHGVTTAPAKKQVKNNVFVDVPGAYSFSAYSMEEGSALNEILSADLIINVVDALTLKSGLNFTREIIKRRKKTVVFVTKTKRLKKRGGRLDICGLSKYLGVPVFDDVKKLKRGLKQGIEPVTAQNTEISSFYYEGSVALSRADRLFYNNFFSVSAFVFAIVLMFFIAFAPHMPGVILKELTERGLGAVCAFITGKMQHVPTISFIEEGIFGGVGSVLSFLPQIGILYLFLTFLDECGIAGALAFTTDGLFEKLSLSGRAAFSLASGFGCTTAAIATTRGYCTPAAQKRTVAILPFIPCGAKLPVFLTFLTPLFKNPFPAVTCLYFAGLIFSLVAAAVLRGGHEDMLSEVSPITFPSVKTVAIKLCFYLKGFIIKVTGTVAAFCILSWFLSHFSINFKYVPAQSSMLAAISRAVLPLFIPMGIDDWRIAYALLCGFAAKENIAASICMLCPAGIELGLSQTVSVCTFILLSPACISAFAASCKEVGVKFSLKCVLIQFLTAFGFAYAVRLPFLL